MTLQSSGTICLDDLAAEFGGTAPHCLSEYYRGGGLVPDTATNSGIPTSGTICLDDFYGGDVVSGPPSGTYSRLGANGVAGTAKTPEQQLYSAGRGQTYSQLNGVTTYTETSPSITNAIDIVQIAGQMMVRTADGSAKQWGRYGAGMWSSSNLPGTPVSTPGPWTGDSLSFPRKGAVTVGVGIHQDDGNVIHNLSLQSTNAVGRSDAVQNAGHSSEYAVFSDSSWSQAGTTRGSYKVGQITWGANGNWEDAAQCYPFASAARKTDGRIWVWGQDYNVLNGVNTGAVPVDVNNGPGIMSPLQLVGSLNTWTKLFSGGGPRGNFAANKSTGNTWFWGLDEGARIPGVNNTGSFTFGQTRSSPIQCPYRLAWETLYQFYTTDNKLFNLQGGILSQVDGGRTLTNKEDQAAYFWDGEGNRDTHRATNGAMYSWSDIYIFNGVSIRQAGDQAGWNPGGYSVYGSSGTNMMTLHGNGSPGWAKIS
jgi:hypothetical protein